MRVWNVLQTSRWKYRTQKSPFWHHRTILSGCIFAAEACSDNRKKILLNTDTSPHMSSWYGKLRLPVPPRPPVVSTVSLASSGLISGSPLGEWTVLRMRLYIVLTRCVRGVHSHEDIMLRIRAGVQVLNTTKHERLYWRWRIYIQVMRATSLSSLIDRLDCTSALYDSY